VNNIVIKFKKIHFDKDTKEEVNKFAKTYRMAVTYYYGYNLLVLHYDDYHETENLFFISEEKEPFKIISMKRYVR